DAVENGGPAIELGAGQQVVQACHGGTGGRVHHNHRVTLRGRYYSRSRGRHRAEHRPTAHAVLPHIASIIWIDLAHTAHATTAANRGFASPDVEIVSIPGAGRDRACPTLRTVATGGHLVLPHRSSPDVIAIEGIILAILVGCSHHESARAGGEERGRRSEIAVAG